jgi:hypothetical protein
MKGYSWETTICVFTGDAHVIAETKKFAAVHGMLVHEAEIETDLVGYIYCMAVIDEKLLTEGVFLDYLNEVNEKDERTISHTNIGREDYTRYFFYPLEFSFEMLQHCLLDFLEDVKNRMYS